MRGRTERKREGREREREKGKGREEGDGSFILVNKQTLVQARLLPAILSVASLSMALVQVQSGGVAILRCPQVYWHCYQLCSALLSLLLSLCHRVAVSTANAKPSIAS